MMPVPKIWPNSTIAILAGGPSLTQADVDLCRNAGCRIIAIKDAIRMASDADVLYSGEVRWWRHYGPTLEFAGLRYGIQSDSPPPVLVPGAGPWGVSVLRNTGPVGLERDPSGLRTGKNSGYQAVGIARHLGAKTILLLGFDMQPGAQGRDNWFSARPYAMPPSPYKDFRECFDTIVEPLQVEGIEVVNCTPGSALRCWPIRSLAEALEQQVAA